MASIIALSLGGFPVAHDPLALRSSGSGQNRLVIKPVIPCTRKRHHKLGGIVAANLLDAGEDAVAKTPSLDRRELLAGTVAGGVSLIGAAGPAHAEPVGNPILKTCRQGQVFDGGNQLFVACCAPKPKNTPIDFKPDTGPIRLRRAAHLQDENYIAKYNEAYKRMKALPEEDPRNFLQQANVHCAYCNFGYSQDGAPRSRLQIHHSWLFFPWHRWYLYFHEKILGSLIGDPEFALPFWNWDNQQGGSTIPAMFLREGSALYNANRNKGNTQRIINLTDAFDDKVVTPEYVEQVKRENLNQMWKNVVDARTWEGFLGAKYSKADGTPKTDGSVEGGCHAAGHVFVGDFTNKTFGEDMGNFYSAGRDPLFYSHHTNVDRLWDVWTRMGRDNSKDDDFLNVEFLFFDENADMVKCKVKDCLDGEEKLKSRYEFMPSDSEWITYKPVSLSQTGGGSVAVTSLVPGMAAMAAEYPELRAASTTSGVTQVTSQPLTVTVARPSGKPTGNVDEILMLEDLEVPMASTAAFSVFINLPGANDKTGADCAEYVGSFQNIPHFMPGMSDMTFTTNARFSIRSNVETLGLSDASKITVTLVPKGRSKDLPFTLKGATISYS